MSSGFESLESLESLETLQSSTLVNIIAAFGNVADCKGRFLKLIQLKDPMMRRGGSIQYVAVAGDNRLFVQLSASVNTIFVCNYDFEFQYIISTPRKLKSFFISNYHDEIYTLDDTLLNIDVFDLEGNLKRSWPSFEFQVRRMLSYDQIHIYIGFNEEEAHVFDRNGRLIYGFRNGFNKTDLLYSNDNFHWYFNTNTFFKFSWGSYLVSPFGEIYHFVREGAFEITRVTVYRLQGRLTCGCVENIGGGENNSGGEDESEHMNELSGEMNEVSGGWEDESWKMNELGGGNSRSNDGDNNDHDHDKNNEENSNNRDNYMKHTGILVPTREFRIRHFIQAPFYFLPNGNLCATCVPTPSGSSYVTIWE